MNRWLKGYLFQSVGFLFLVLSPASRAGEARLENGDNQTFSLEDHFAHGRYEAAFTSGALFSPVGPSRGRPTIDYTITGLQLGYMLDNVHGAAWLRGNLELAGDTFGSAIFQGAGTYVAGETLWLRYNFLPQRSRRLAPYIQAGA